MELTPELIILLVGTGLFIAGDKLFKGKGTHAKKNAMTYGGAFIGAIGLVLVLTSYVGAPMAIFAVAPEPEIVKIIGECESPDDDTNITWTVQNSLNTTSSTKEYLSPGIVIYTEDGTYKEDSTLSGSTGYSWTGGVCGKTYNYKLYSTSSILSGTTEGSAMATKSTLEKISAPQQGTLYFKLWSNDDASFVYDEDDAAKGDWDDTGTTYTGTTDNATATTVGTDGYVDLTAHMKMVAVDTQFADVGDATYFAVQLYAVQANSTDWDEETLSVSVAGVEAEDVTASMPGKITSEYQRVFKLPDKVNKAHIVKVDVFLQAANNQNPDSDLKFAALVNSRYLSTDGVSVNADLVDDSSSHNDIVTKQTFTLDIA